MVTLSAVEVRSVVEDYLAVEKHSRRADMLRNDLVHLFCGFVEHPWNYEDQFTLAVEHLGTLPEHLGRMSRKQLEVYWAASLMVAVGTCLFGNLRNSREYLRLSDRIGQELRARK